MVECLLALLNWPRDAVILNLEGSNGYLTVDRNLLLLTQCRELGRCHPVKALEYKGHTCVEFCWYMTVQEQLGIGVSETGMSSCIAISDVFIDAAWREERECFLNS